MNSLRGLVVINPTLKYNRARTLTHSFRQRSPFTSLTGGKGQEGWEDLACTGIQDASAVSLPFFPFSSFSLNWGVEPGTPSMLGHH